MRSILIILISCCLLGCDDTRIFEENKPINDYSWSSADPTSFDFEITDTSKRYNIYINIRHGVLYEFQNLWVKTSTTFPDGRIKQSRVNLRMANIDGRWHGRCLGDICDRQVAIQMNAYFDQLGTYRFSLIQNMRKDPLPQIMEVGFRVETIATQESR